MNYLSVKRVAAISCAVLLSNLALGQSYTGYIETDTVTASDGTIVNFGDFIDGAPVNVFYGTTTQSLEELGLTFANEVSNYFDFKAALEAITWSPMVEYSNPALADWWTGDVPIEVSVGDRPIVVIMNADGPGSLVPGNEIGIVASSFVPQSSLDSWINAFEFGQPWEVVLGQTGSVQLTTLVPEPSTYALLTGLLVLSFAIWRRRR